LVTVTLSRVYNKKTKGRCVYDCMLMLMHNCGFTEGPVLLVRTVLEVITLNYGQRV